MIHALDLVGRSLADGWWMFWATLWALVVGFTLSGAVQAFVSRARMRRSLGDHRPATIVRASLFGMASSSCSYAASALAKTLFVRGADFTAAQAFMFASTNLVLELGIVLWLLVGWQFALAEFVGGALMVALIAAVLPRLVSPDEVAAARQHVAAADRAEGSGHDGDDDEAAGPVPAASGWRTAAGWADAAGYTISDLTMLRRELVIGFVVAGFADKAVPLRVYTALFVTGHGVWSALENVIVGPFLAIVAFVCSIGNVPLAAALWSGGSAFGGVVAFVFADLITLPLLFIYRRYYGARLTWKLLAIYWALMSASGLAVEYLFRALAIAPSHPARAHGAVGTDRFGLNATTILDFLALGVLAALIWLYRNRDRFGGGRGYAKDPVCGMQVEIAHPGSVASYDGELVYFCSDHCRLRWERQTVGSQETWPTSKA